MKAEGGRRQSGIPTPGLGPSSISLVVVTHPKRYGITLPGHIALRWGSSLGGCLVGSQHDLRCAHVVLQTLNPVWRGEGGRGPIHGKDLH